MSLLRSRETLLAAAIAALVLLISTRFPGFARPANLGNVFNDSAILMVLALGQTAVILTKCIDLSVAANLALTGMVAAMLDAAFPGVPVPLLMLLALAMGAALGAVNGLLVWKLDLPSIVVTLGTLTIYRGTIFRVHHAKGIAGMAATDPSLLSLFDKEADPTLADLPKLYTDPKSWPKLAVDSDSAK